ncbi:prefoldin chaperone subunit [Blastocystis sp. ATCC 50177/Nand II]|uniref:Prefoldin chaperone subunit n=1 Tax=Blastocystis sp. subtype 1 (strain ATCC 50177 / NandII) TaxID=478820 RepID=A0A196SIP4_BLAHN|nr:prefoldin chaperone subunit [Blastocystis sp. ATCC 50177/Nand II]
MEEVKVSKAQIRKYEDLIENRIKATLAQEVEQLRELSSSVEQYEVLKTNIEVMKRDSKSSVSSLVNLGSEVYAQAKAQDRNHIFVNIGLGFFVEFTLDEALAFIEKKLAQLHADLVRKNEDVERVKQHYYSAIHALEQLKDTVA